MSFRLRSLFERLRASYWFVPGIVVVGSIVLAFVTLAIDHRLPQNTLLMGPLFRGAGQPDAARALLSTVAGSLITVAGVVFSITIVALSLASQQFGPRLLGGFMRDRGNQLSLGTFLGTFVYSILVLRVVRGALPDAGITAYVPQLSVTIAFVFTLVSVGVLIYFIDHAAQSIQVSHILARVSDQLGQQIRGLPSREDDSPSEPGLPGAEPGDRVTSAGGSPSGAADGTRTDQNGAGSHGNESRDLPEGFAEGAVTLRARRTGYVQAIDHDALVKLAQEHEVVIRLHHAPGSFVLLGGPLADVYPAEEAEDLRGRIERFYVLGDGRTASQDHGFLFDQLLEVALRALSPGINDPFTALTCIDRMTDGLNQLSLRRTPPSVRRDEDGSSRLIIPTTTVSALTEHLFGELRGYAAGDLMVARHMATVLRGLQATTSNQDLQRAVGTEVQRLLESAEPRLSASDFSTLKKASKRVTAWIRLEDEQV